MKIAMLTNHSSAVFRFPLSGWQRGFGAWGIR